MAATPYSRPGLRIKCRSARYCQTGMIMSAAALLKKKPQPTDTDINEAVTNICRCGTYTRIRAAIHTGRQKIWLEQRDAGVRTRR